ncbi:hypothetical protein K523DRAFT_337722 [Schizophyllum commune Tattone D]|nr:hypothetical protein K523DRAFT_337722 [Schizophyllum commune Tattone D]
MSIVSVSQSVLQAISRALFSSSAIPSVPSDSGSLPDLPNEILHEVACLLDKPGLYVFLLVNHRFHAIAEPVLWRELSSLVPILRLLPEYFDIQNLYPTWKGIELPHDVWERNRNIIRLAGHVRKLLIHPIADLNLDCHHVTFYEGARGRSMDWNALKAFARSIPVSSDFILFPLLQHLEVGSSFTCGISTKVLRPLLGPNVRTIVAHCPMNRLDHCIWRCDLRAFAYLEPSPTIYGRVQHVLPRMALTIPALHDIAPVISKMHTLRLRLNHGDGLLPLLRPAQATLRVFDIDIGHLAETVTDYKLLSLRSLTVRRQRPAFVCALAGSVHLETIELHDLIVYIQERPPPPSQARWSLKARHLEALTSCSNPLSIDIQWVALAPSWPHLQYFRIQPCGSRRRDGNVTANNQVHAPPTATLAALIPFARSCLYLEELSIPLKMDELVPSLEGDPIPSQTRLTKFDLGEREIRLVGADTRDVVQFLRALFPELRHVKAARTNNSANDLAWDEVADALASNERYNELLETRTNHTIE